MNFFKRIFSISLCSFNACIVAAPVPPIKPGSTKDSSFNVNTNVEYGIQQIQIANKKRKGKTKNSHSNKLKLEICDYYRQHGGSYMDISRCATYKKYNLSKSTVGDIILGEKNGDYV